MGICVVLEMAKKDPENHIYEVLVLPELLCLQLHPKQISVFGTLGLSSRSLEVLPQEMSDLGTLAFSSRSLKVPHFLGKSLIWGLWPSPPEVSKYYIS